MSDVEIKETALGFTPAPFDALAHRLTTRICQVVSAATLHLIHESDAYCCASWRLNERAERELFIEQPGSAVAPFILRVGVYFQDAPLTTAQAATRQVAFAALVNSRSILQPLGVSCTFTPGSGTRDDRVFGWSDTDLIEWLTGPSDNRDLVWRWDMRSDNPSEKFLEEVLSALLPVWVAWNSL